MTLYRERYRLETGRLAGWDYTSEGWYFVTICTRNRTCCLGEVQIPPEVDSEPDGPPWPPAGVRLSPIGRIVAEEWLRTPEVRPSVVLDAWVIMPNHLHGILHIGGTGVVPPVETPRRGVSAMPAAARLAAGSLGAIIGQFKSVCTKRIRAAGTGDFGWQERFYDRILRDANALDRARHYVMLNPQRWEMDRGTGEGIFM